jgi:hypothetical protein
MNVINRKSIEVAQNLHDTNGVFEVEINIEFKPSAMIVRQVSYFQDKNAIGIYSINCHLVGTTIANFMDPCSVSLEKTFILDKPVRGAQKFQIMYLGLPEQNLIGDLAFTLEFVEYGK